MSIKSYRSTGLSRKMCSALGCFHVHVDGFRDYKLVEAVVKALEAMGFPGKFNVVHDFIAGPQRILLPQVYETHTPMWVGQEQLDFFSTTVLASRDDAFPAVQKILSMLCGSTGAVVELEQVIAKVEHGTEILGSDRLIKPIEDAEFSGVQNLSHPYEIHHGFDSPKSPHPPLRLVELLAFCTEVKIPVGGWFVFEKEQSWAYRSNAFVSEAEWWEAAKRENTLLTIYLQAVGWEWNVRPRTVVEREIGIWHTS